MTDQTEYIQGHPIGKYEVEKELGRGGMGAVLLARDTVLDRQVALKVIKRDLIIGDATTSMKGKVEARFVREAKVSAMINHTNIATVYDATLEGDVWFIAMEYIDGESLAEVLKRGKPFDPLKAARLLHWIADGLRHAWVKHSIIHRDVKPANVMITTDGIVKLIDLGIAKPMVEDEDTHALTMENEMVATPRYSAPEQMLGKELTEKADIFALGVLAYETLTQAPAFRGASVADLYAKKSTRDFVPIGEARDDLPEDLANLIDRMLEPSPDDRPGYDEILSVLGVLCNTGTGTQIVDATTAQPGQKPRTPIWVGVAACLAVGAAVVVWAARPKPEPEPTAGETVMSSPEDGKQDDKVGADFIYGKKLRLDLVWVPKLNGWAARHETTVGQLQKCNSFKSKTVEPVEDIDFSSPSMPAVMVSRKDARTYCNWLNQLRWAPKGFEFRLPSVKEWRVLRPRRTPRASDTLAPAAKAKRNDLELAGVIGNVWELTEDGYVCGGSWLSEPWEYVPNRPVHKMVYDDGRADHNVGFRVVLMPVKQ